MKKLGLGKMEGKSRKSFLAIVVLSIILIFLLYPPVILTELRVDFEQEDYSAGNHWKVLASNQKYAGPQHIQKTYEKLGAAYVVFWDFVFREGTCIKRFDPIDYWSGEEIRVRDITFYFNGFYGGKLKGKELLQAFVPNEQVQMYLTDTGSLGLLIQGEDSQLAATKYFAAFYSAAARRCSRTGLLYLIPILAAAVFAVEFYRKRVWQRENSRLEWCANTFLYLVGIAAILLILLGTFSGTAEVNPDESEAFYCVNYYMHHWKIPDMRELEPEAFSKFGTARLSELNLYYILAAQIARFFTFEHAMRFFGFLMAVGLFYLAFVCFRKNRYLLAVLFLTPQVWYLYTYCTSDALDFAVSVLVLYQIANPESMLQKLLEGGVEKRNIWKVCLLGFLFSNIFMAKQNYYVVAIYAFSMLVTELFFVEKEKRRKRFIACLWVAGAALVFLGIRYIPEFLHYGIHKQQVILELQNEIAIPKLRPNSPPEVQSSAFNLHGKGVPLTELLFHKGFHTMLFRSFAGTYGCLEFPSPKWYYWVMGILYIALYGLTMASIWRQKGKKEQKIKCGLLHLSALISYLLVVYNAYFIDFQAQGRYMLPVLIFFAHLVSLNPENGKKKWFQILICLTAGLSLYSFAVYGIPNIGPS